MLCLTVLIIGIDKDWNGMEVESIVVVVVVVVVVVDVCEKKMIVVV
jgi:hypothetical protein